MQGEIINCIGNWEVSLDSKGRISVPANLKKKFPANFKHFVLTRAIGNDKCIYMFYQDNFDEFVKNIGFSKVNVFDNKEWDFKRTILSTASEVEPDSTDRILIPTDLRVYSNITKNVKIVGMTEFYEIWDQDQIIKKVQSTTEAELKETQQKFRDKFSKKND